MPYPTFLFQVCGDVLHVSGVAKRLTQTHGSYSVWAKRRAEQQKAFARTVELRRAEIAELKAYAGHGVHAVQRAVEVWHGRSS